MTELVVAEWLLPPAVSKSCSQRSLPSQAPPGSVFFLPEGMLAAKAPQDSLSRPHKGHQEPGSNTQCLLCLSSLCFIRKTSSTIMVETTLVDVPCPLGCPSTWWD